MRRPDPKSRTSKIARLLAYGGAITPRDSWGGYGLYRLSGVIYNLRRRGLPIETTPIGRRRFGRYWVPYDQQQRARELIDAWGSADQQGSKAKMSKHGHSTANGTAGGA